MSVAVAMPVEAVVVSALQEPSLYRVVSFGTKVNTGFTVSATVIFCVWVAAVLPQLSFTVHTRSKL